MSTCVSLASLLLVPGLVKSDANLKLAMLEAFQWTRHIVMYDCPQLIKDAHCCTGVPKQLELQSI